jgi:hypothetical protein
MPRFKRSAVFNMSTCLLSDRYLIHALSLLFIFLTVFKYYMQSSGKSSSPPATSAFNSEMYIADGDYIKDIEVNDLRNRYTLTKGATQKMVKLILLSSGTRLRY